MKSVGLFTGYRCKAGLMMGVFLQRMLSTMLNVQGLGLLLDLNICNDPHDHE